MSESDLILASGSPRRHQLLDMLGIRHEVNPVGIEERRREGETPIDYACRLAEEKAVTGSARRPGRWVLGADTIVVIDGDVLEKPDTEASAVTMLQRLSGREHRVISAVALACGFERFVEVDETSVWFRPVDAEVIRAYVATGEPMDKAGGYGIQGQGAVLVERIDGDYFGVMGLPLVKVVKLLERAGRPYYFTR